jgi:hypothetical protein
LFHSVHFWTGELEIEIVCDGLLSNTQCRKLIDSEVVAFCEWFCGNVPGVFTGTPSKGSGVLGIVGTGSGRRVWVGVEPRFGRKCLRTERMRRRFGWFGRTNSVFMTAQFSTHMIALSLFSMLPCGTLYAPGGILFAAPF